MAGGKVARIRTEFGSKVGDRVFRDKTLPVLAIFST